MHKNSFNSIREILKIEKDAIVVNINREVINGIKRAADILIKRKKGRIAVMGIGKSGLVGRKIASTLSSTGSPAFPIPISDVSNII